MAETVWSPDMSAQEARALARQVRPGTGGMPQRPQLSATTLKVIVVLRPEDVLAQLPEPPPGVGRIPITVAVAGRVLQVLLNPKGVRRARKAIQESGLDGVAVILQGKLAPGDVLEEAGLSAQPKGLPARAAAVGVTGMGARAGPEGEQ